MKMIKVITALLLLALPQISLAGNGTLSATGELLIERIVPGSRFSMESAKGLFRVTNNSDNELVVELAAVSPEKILLRKGFKALPALKWVKIGKNVLVLKPGETAYPDISILVPDSRKYRGKKFQFHIWSKVTSGKKSAFRIIPGIESVFLMTTAR